MLLAQETNGVKIWFTYDAGGNLVGLQYDGRDYYYVRNGQGDITGILDSTGYQVVVYKYDSWGKLVTLDAIDSVGAANPFRYRGYYYDTDTGFYYLTSRYYDPEVCRFINADEPCISSATLDDVTGKNLYAYCDNNPIVRADDNGYAWYDNLWDGVKTYFNGVGDGFCDYYKDQYNTVKSFVSSPIAVYNDFYSDPKNYWNFCPGKYIYDIGADAVDKVKAIASGDLYSMGYEAGQTTADNVEQMAIAAITAGVAKVQPKIMSKIVNSKLFAGNGGYGFKIGNNIEILYQNPSFQKKYGMSGGTFFSYSARSGKNFRIDWDPLHGLHSHPPGHK